MPSPEIAQTSESRIAAIFFIMDIIKLPNDYFCVFFNWLFHWIFSQNNHSKSDEMQILIL